MANINWDAGSVLKKLAKLGGSADKVVDGALGDVADTVLNLSEREVPHDIGTLQLSGVVDRPPFVPFLTRIVGYHTKYAARLHEHPEFRFQKGRKGKYLEDPIKKNSNNLKKAFQSVVKHGLSRL